MNTESQARDIPMFFVVGRARSGTTLLRCLLDAHPMVNIPLECAFVIHLYPKYGKKKRWDAPTLEAFFNDVISYPKFHFWTLNRDVLREALLNAGSDSTYAGLCRIVYLHFRSFFHKDELRLLGDKNPSYSFHTRKLSKIFPGSRFIHITRDYRDNIVSMIRAGFEAPNIASLAYRWKFSNSRVLRHSRRNPELFLRIRYEDLVNDPEKILNRICQFLGIPYDVSMLGYHSRLDEMLKVYPRELVLLHHSSLLKPINNEGLGEWKHALKEPQIKTADYVAGRMAEKLGYQRVYHRKSAAFMLRCLPGMLYGRMLYLFLGLLQRLPLKLRMKITNYLAVKYKHDWKVFGPGKA